MNPVRLAALIGLALTTGGCNLVVLAPAGDIAGQQRDVLIIATLLMLIIIIPVMALVVMFAWRYRAANTEARYEPDWDHSTQLELVIWAIPLLIIIALGAVTWMGTHLLDPYRPLGRIDATRAVTEEHRPLEVQVVALDWKWLFIYPEQGIATINELAAPVDRPVNFRLTSSSVMNAFYVPALAGMIYAMPGMETKLHSVINAEGDYQGLSSQYSGHGFSGMRFRFHGQSPEEFDRWVEEARASQTKLDRAEYLRIERPSENEAPRFYGSVDPVIFDAAVNMCVEPGKMCMSEMMAIDSRGGLGLAGITNTLPLAHDKFVRRGSAIGPRADFVAAICTPEEALQYARPATPAIPDSMTRILGHGLTPPGTTPVPAAMLPPAPGATAPQPL
jgi:cytochrome o ubiquinol oxidase subunit II